MLVPTPGGVLEEVYQKMTDPNFVMVARLAKGPRDQSDQTVDLATLVEADFPGYLPITLTPDLEDAFDDVHYGELSPFRLSFVAGAIVTPQLITHVYVTKTYEGAGLSLVQAVPFVNPLIVDTEGQEIEFDLTVGAVDIPDA